MALKREIQVLINILQTLENLATLLYAFYENIDFNVILCTNVTKDVLK